MRANHQASWHTRSKPTELLKKFKVSLKLAFKVPPVALLVLERDLGANHPEVAGVLEGGGERPLRRPEG